jgi:hypothetical protein
LDKNRPICTIFTIKLILLCIGRSIRVKWSPLEEEGRAEGQKILAGWLMSVLQI